MTDITTPAQDIANIAFEIVSSAPVAMALGLALAVVVGWLAHGWCLDRETNAAVADYVAAMAAEQEATAAAQHAAAQCRVAGPFHAMAAQYQAEWSAALDAQRVARAAVLVAERHYTAAVSR